MSGSAGGYPGLGEHRARFALLHGVCFERNDGFLKSAGIIGLGKALPERVLTNAEIETMVETSDEWIFERTGIRKRRVAGENETSASLGTAAAAEALRMAGVDPADVDLIICGTTSPDTLFPSTACHIQQRLGCVNAAAFDLAAACAGFVYALAVGSELVASGAHKMALIIGADVLTKFTDWTDRGTCVLFGDGAGAAVVAPVEDGRGVLSYDLGADGTGTGLLVIPGGGGLHPASHQTVDDRLHYIKMEGREVFKFAVKIMGESSERSLAKCGLSPHDVDCFVPHQANTRIIDSATRRLGIAPERVFTNVADYGNTSAASVPIALYEAFLMGRIREGDLVVVVGFGAGLTWASCVLRWTMSAVPEGDGKELAGAARVDK